MASVWKRLQRVNKRAAKFQYTASYHRIDVELTPKWKPNKLSIVWTRRSRRVVTEPLEWEPSLKDPLKGSVIFTVPENQTVAVTLFRDSRTNELEDKDWTFVLEDVSPTGKRRRLAASALNLRRHASLAPAQRALKLSLEPTSRKLRAARIHLTLHCVLLREGQATDEDMQSLASLLSVNNNSDIAVLEDLDEDDYTLSDNSTRQMLDLRQQMEEMTQSLTNSDIAATPNSVQSLNFDNSRTPTAPMSPESTTPTTPVPPKEVELDLKINETQNAPKSRPEYLSNLTKLAMKTEPPKFTSTPKIVPEKVTEDIKVDSLKGVVFKPKTVAKRNLKPLELKTNLNNISLDTNDNEEDSDKTPVAEIDKLFPLKGLDKDKTPVQDLLEWCSGVTSEYPACRVTNLTTSFRSGLAFCAIIHHFRPDLIDFSGLQAEQAESNVRAALEASARLGIAQVLTVADVCRPPAPDKLAIMTYLFQLRAYFTGNELQVEQLGNDETESSYLVGRHDTDGALPAELFSREVAARRSRGPRSQPERRASPGSPDKVAIRDVLLHSKTLLGKMLSPARERDRDRERPNSRWFAEAPRPPPEPVPARPEKLMTRKELTDPFGSDDEEEPQVNNTNDVGNGVIATDQEQKPQIEPATTDPLTSPPQETITNGTDSKAIELPKPTPQLLSRHDELKEKARQLLEATKREARDKERIKRQGSKDGDDKEVVNGLRNGDPGSPKKVLSEEERQATLRERARRLIADARAGLVSPTSPLSPSRNRGTLEIISKQSVLDELAAAGVEQLEGLVSRPESVPSSPGSRKSAPSPDGSEHAGSESRDSPTSPNPLSALVERLSPDLDTEQRSDGGYLAGELAALEREQRAVDERAAALEKQLRRVMDAADDTELAALEREQRAVDERAAALEKQLRRVMDAADDTEEEDRLMSQWFNLVNKKNALLRRQMQLNILEQEEDLSRRCELLARELRLSLGVEEWRKTPGQKRRERLLLQELLSAVNERDRLVQEMDEQEKAIAEDDEIQRNLSNVEIQRKNNCILQ
ncbi:EH domain-binding protein 1-like protein 1 [Melitaea cinxia]|uniref:EH domain-binding protein 1-like protein 1 n=1 Tax=Melitaea cinxia TaxID=113334 RepID=UPI001E26EACC|nr:EH domain-binding protein 1-like protein 1 [Melitaea cinxia]